MKGREDNGKGIFAEVAAAMTPKQKRYALTGILAMTACYYGAMFTFLLIGFVCAVQLLANPTGPGAVGRGFAGLLFLVLFAIMKEAMRKTSDN